MGGITKRSGSKSLSDPLVISRFEELRVCMLAYCGNNSRISIAANAGANRFSVIHNLWDDVTSLDLTVKPPPTTTQKGSPSHCDPEYGRLRPPRLLG